VNEAKARPTDQGPIDPISPELALVDAELARLARSLMPEVPGRPSPVPGPLAAAESEGGTLRTAIAPKGAHFPAAASAQPEPRAVTSRPVVPRPVVGAGAFTRPLGENKRPQTAGSRSGSTARRQVLRLVPVLAALSLVLVGVAVAIPRLTANDPRLDGTGAPTPRAATSAASKTEESRDQSRRRSTPVPSPAPAATAAVSPRAGIPHTGKRRSSPPPPAAVTPSPHVFVWLPVRGVSRYKVEFFRSGRKVFEAATSKARLKLPRRWTFAGRRFELTPGNYRWSVRPGFGPRSKARYGAAIVKSRWTVPK
jgi:hypothetical protein